MKSLKQITAHFRHLNIAVFGDLMLDKYIFGKVERISPEAPIPIVLVKRESFALGGAANVAANISSMQGKAYLFGVLGQDEAQTTFVDKCRNSNIDTSGILTDADKHTIQKIRVIGQHQQLLRIDYETGSYIEENCQHFFLNRLKAISNPDAIVISDYAKGTISESLVQEIKSYSWQRKIPLLIDPKPLHKEWYKNASLITPNLKEAQEISGIIVNSTDSLEKCGTALNQLFDCDIIITTGEKGMSIFPKNKKVSHIPTQATEVFDVSGAGDTVVAVLSLALASGAKLHEAAVLANLAAGIKVKKLGTTPVQLAELNSYL